MPRVLSIISCRGGDPSGIRLGSPTLTTRGMKEKEMAVVAAALCRVVDNVDNEKVIGEVRKEIFELCARFPIYDALVEK